MKPKRLVVLPWGSSAKFIGVLESRHLMMEVTVETVSCFEHLRILSQEYVTVRFISDGWSNCIAETSVDRVRIFD